MTASAPTGLVFDIFRGIAVDVLITSLGGTSVVAMTYDTAASTDQGMPAGLTLAGTGVVTGTPTGAASAHYGSNYSAGVTGEGSYAVTVKDTGNSITGISVTFRLHDEPPGQADETDVAALTVTEQVDRENFYSQETGG
jgi:hypothetical protein